MVVIIHDSRIQNTVGHGEGVCVVRGVPHMLKSIEQAFPFLFSNAVYVCKSYGINFL